MNLEVLRTARVVPWVVVRIAGVVNWDPHSRSDDSKGHQQSRQLEGSASLTNLNRLEPVEDEGLLEQDGDRELFEDPFAIIRKSK
jgi:hypothetical protein